MLKITNIKKTFNPGTVNEVRAIDGVTIEIEQGSFVCVLGTNGSGKSTTLNAVAGTFMVDEGYFTGWNQYYQMERTPAGQTHWTCISKPVQRYRSKHVDPGKPGFGFQTGSEAWPWLGTPKKQARRV